MNDVNYDINRSKDIYSCFQADKYSLNNLIKRYNRVIKILGKDLA